MDNLQRNLEGSLFVLDESGLRFEYDGVSSSYVVMATNSYLLGLIERSFEDRVLLYKIDTFTRSLGVPRKDVSLFLKPFVEFGDELAIDIYDILKKRVSQKGTNYVCVLATFLN